MLAPQRIPSSFETWNRRWGAPRGLERGRWPILRRREVQWRAPRLVGPFGFQLNNDTRRFEYPWAFHSVPVEPGMRCLEVGGSLSGFQFVLAWSGAEVVNVD